MNKNSRIHRRNVRVEAKKNKGDVISRNQRRNMQMVINKNVDADGRTFTVTAHIPITNDSPVIFKNHDYMKDSYKQPTKFRAKGESLI